MANERVKESEADLDIVEDAPQETASMAKSKPTTESSAALMSVCIMLSRVTGFVRTWVMAFALGSTLLSTSYQVANNLPTQLYELVVGGILVTAFLPVYLSVKKRLGEGASNDYASNLFSLVVVFLGIVSLACFFFPEAGIFTQSFMTDQEMMSESVLFFKYFAIQILFYGATAIISGLLNAHREYLWPAIAPVANNFVVITAFILYALLAPTLGSAAIYILAVGSPLGVFVQLAIQYPALRREGIRLRWRINLRDAALKETVSLGLPALAIAAFSLVIVSVQNAAALRFAENGPSILLYARQWFTLPYSFLVIPIATALFTELAEMYADRDETSLMNTIVRGCRQIVLLTVPVACLLAVYSVPLVSLYRAGAFEMEHVTSVANYLAVLAFALPFYGINTYFQKVFSSIRKLWFYAGMCALAGLFQLLLTLGIAFIPDLVTIEGIALAEIMYYLISDIALILILKRCFPRLHFSRMVRTVLIAVVLGAFGALVGFGSLYLLQMVGGPLEGNILQALIYLTVGGLVSLVAAFAPAVLLKLDEARVIISLTQKILGRLRRS